MCVYSPPCSAVFTMQIYLIVSYLMPLPEGGSCTQQNTDMRDKHFALGLGVELFFITPRKVRASFVNTCVGLQSHFEVAASSLPYSYKDSKGACCQKHNSNTGYLSWIKMLLHGYKLEAREVVNCTAYLSHKQKIFTLYNLLWIWIHALRLTKRTDLHKEDLNV